MNITTHAASISGMLKQKFDVLVLPIAAQPKGKKKKGEAVGVLSTLPATLRTRIEDVLETTEFTGAHGQTFFIEGGKDVSAKRILLLGVGELENITIESVRRAVGGVVLVCQKVKAAQVGIFVDDLLVPELFSDDIASAIAESVELASYRFLKYKKEDAKKWNASLAKTWTLVSADKATALTLEDGVAHGRMNAAATILARDLINEPAIHVTPKSLSNAARDIVKKNKGITATIFGEAQMKKLGMGSLLSVAAGSAEEAQFIHLVYKPKAVAGSGAKKKVKKIAICGKGITFDSGGLSIKPGNYMHGMKMDMAGAAAVLGLFSVIEELAPNVEVHGVIPATENMPSGTATRPGDVVTAYDGTTIEVTNTDAEGRLVLADAIAWVVDTQKPDAVIDLATLTGAVIVALGQEVAAYFTKDEELKDAVECATLVSGEMMWQLPLVEEYMPMVKSPVADLDNSPRTSWAGSTIGALFLQHFAGKTPWMHWDIAGPAIVEKQMLSYVPVGGSGFGVRTLIEMLAHFESENAAE